MCASFLVKNKFDARTQKVLLFVWFGGPSSLVLRVVELRRVCCELLSQGREWFATWRTTEREWVPRLGDSRGVAWLGVVTLTERLVTAWV